MPGKSDFGLANADGQYYPGSKEFRAWDEGWQYRYAGTAISNPKTDNPYTAPDIRKEAWDGGWESANTNSAGLQRMPATTGTAP